MNIRGVIRVRFYNGFRLEFNFHGFSGTRYVVVFGQVVAVVQLRRVHNSIARHLLHLLVFLRHLVPLHKVNGNIRVTT